MDPFKVGSRRKISSKSHPPTENIPLISVGAQSRSQVRPSSYNRAARAVLFRSRSTLALVA